MLKNNKNYNLEIILKTSIIYEPITTETEVEKHNK